MIKLKELLDSPVEYSVIHDMKYHFSASFEVDSLSYVFNSTVENHIFLGCSASINVADINFYQKTKYGETSFSITNTGNASIVFSTVVKIIRDRILKNKDIDGIYFSAKEKSRKKLYDVFAKKIEQENITSFSSFDQLNSFLEDIFIKEIGFKPNMPPWYSLRVNMSQGSYPYLFIKNQWIKKYK